MNKTDKTNNTLKHVTLTQKEGRVLKWNNTSKEK